uniref:DDE Tnp4 domain-containing protein n=1 Tax=Haemonchus contortus TaxID=6289 RepID=W6N9W0_HAECO
MQDCRSLHAIEHKENGRQQRSSPPTHTKLGKFWPVQHQILVDRGFAQRYRLVRPYIHASADTPSKRRFNAEPSSARQAAGSTFGMLSKRFGLLQNTIQTELTR